MNESELLNAKDFFKRGEPLELALAAEMGDTEKIKSLIHNGIDPNAIYSPQMTFLVWACMNKNLASINTLILSCADVDLFAPEGLTPLATAVMFDWEAGVNCLLINQANPNLQDADGDTALHIAVTRSIKDDPEITENTSIVQLLFTHGADPGIRNAFDNTPLMIAVECGAKAAVKIMLSDKARFDINSELGMAFTKFCSDYGYEI